jgi:hypothetical protein
MAADLLRAEWRKNWTADNDWRPCKEEPHVDDDSDGNGEA